MLENKYSKFLTVILIMVIVVIVILLSVFGYDMYRKITTDRDAASVVNEFNKQTRK